MTAYDPSTPEGRAQLRELRPDLSSDDQSIHAGALPAALDCIEAVVEKWGLISALYRQQQRRIEELEAERARPFPRLGVAVDPVEQPALDGEVPK